MTVSSIYVACNGGLYSQVKKLTYWEQPHERDMNLSVNKVLELQAIVMASWADQRHALQTNNEAAISAQKMNLYLIALHIIDRNSVLSHHKKIAADSFTFLPSLFDWFYIKNR